MNRNPATRLFTLCAVASTVLVQGCVLGSFQTFQKIDMDCHVVSARSGLPIEHATVSVSYRPANSGSPRLPPQTFTTNREGYCRVVVPKHTIHISGSDAYVGGYSQVIDVYAKGFANGSISGGFERKRLTDIPSFRCKLVPQ